MLPVKYFTNDEINEILSVPECIEIVEDLFNYLSKQLNKVTGKLEFMEIK